MTNNGKPKKPSKRKLEYYKYLESHEWRQKREEVFIHHGKFCIACKTTTDLQVHHMTYQRVFNEKLRDLRVVCWVCHQEIHRIQKESRTWLRRTTLDYIKNYWLPKEVVVQKKIEKSNKDKEKAFEKSLKLRYSWFKNLFAKELTHKIPNSRERWEFLGCVNMFMRDDMKSWLIKWPRKSIINWWRNRFKLLQEP